MGSDLEFSISRFDPLLIVIVTEGARSTQVD